MQAKPRVRANIQWRAPGEYKRANTPLPQRLQKSHIKNLKND